MGNKKNANVNVRIEENIKEKAEKILDNIGISRASAIDMFYRQIILNRGIPFSLTIPNNIPVLEDMTEEEFDLKMLKGYLESVNGELLDAKEVFKELEKDL